MRYLIIIVLLLFTQYSYSQSANLDSLKTELTRTQEDSIKFNTLNSLIRNYLMISLDSTRVYNDILLQLADTTRDKELATQSYNLASTYYYYNSQIDSCFYYVDKGLSMLQGGSNYKLQSDLYRKLSILSRAQQNFEDYKKYALRSLQIAEQAKDWKLVTSALVVMGNVYYSQNSYSEALKYYVKVDSIHHSKNETTANLSLSLENIALIYIELKNEKALEYLAKSYDVHTQNSNKAGIANTNRLKASYYAAIEERDSVINNLESVLPFYESYNEPNKLIEVYTGLISSYADKEDFNKGSKLLEKSERIVNRPGFNKIGKNQYYFASGIYHLKQKNYDDAILAFNKAQATIPEKGTSFYLGERKEIVEKLALAYSGKGNYKEAVNQFNRLAILKDSLSKQNQVNLTEQLETKYQTQKKEQEITLLKSQNELAEAQKKNQRNIMLGGLGLTTAAGIFLFLGYRNRKKTNDKLRELDQVKSNFFANISHEFRTPLSLISGPIEQQLQKENLPSSERTNLSVAQRNSARLLTLVDQLLDLSKLESGYFSLKVQPSDLGQFLRSLSSSFEFLASENNQTYITTIEVPGQTYWFDRDALEKIITNLISNALKYSPEKETIAIQASISKGKLLFSIKNSGTTLSPQELDTLFNRFQRAGERTPGTGIGLALTKELAILHKGTITVKSEENWTLFDLVLPVHETAFTETQKTKTGAIEKTFPQAQPVSSPKLPKHIDELDIFAKDDKPILLIVDDNEDLRAYLSSLFTETHTIHTAINGKDGLEKALAHVPDLIITDLMMPEDDGITLTRNCKTKEALSHIPIIMLTAKAGDENKILGLETGADAYITKPFNTEILKTTVRNLQETRDTLQERFSQEVVLLPKDIATNATDERFLTNLQKVMDKSLVESDFSSEAFAEAVGMSRMQLHRKLKALTGLSATEFIRSQRLKLAAQMLKKSDINVSQVGYAVGFNNHSYFTKCFKEHYGISPSDYSKNS